MGKVPDNVTNEVERYFEHVDKQMKFSVAVGAKDYGSKGASCGSCTKPACCHQSLYTLLYEVLPAARHLRSAGLDAPELREKLFAAAIQMEGVSRAEYLEQYRPCVFLEEGRCSIYEHRPSRCRDYFVFSPPEDCAPPSEKKIAMADNRKVAVEGFQLEREVTRALNVKETPMRLILGSFPRVLLVALEGMDDGVNFAKHVRAQPWPTEEQLGDWVEGNVPEQKLVQLKSRKRE